MHFGGNWLGVGLGVWMIGTGIDGLKSPGNIIKIVGGVIVLVASIMVA